MNGKTIGIAVVALIIGAGIGYFAHPAASTSVARTGTFTGARGAGATGGGILMGTVAAEDSSSITLDTRDGSSHVVLITPSTTVSKYVAGALSDVSVGSTVMVSGTTNSDGSISATVIQLRPAMTTTQTTTPATTQTAPAQ